MWPIVCHSIISLVLKVTCICTQGNPTLSTTMRHVPILESNNEIKLPEQKNAQYAGCKALSTNVARRRASDSNPQNRNS